MKLINRILAVLMGIVVIILTIKNENWSYLLFFIALILPFAIKLPNIATCIFLLYTFAAIFLGGQVHLYRTTEWFDDFAHFSWGLVIGIVGLYAIHYFKIENTSLLFRIVFIVILGLATSAVWEIFEYASDTLVNTNMQRVETGVTDTMTDILNCLWGNILFVIAYFFEQHYKQDLLINSLIKEIP